MRILVTGASGMLGATVAKLWQDTHEIYATGGRILDHHPFQRYLSFALEGDSYADLMAWSKPDLILHCAAMTDVEACERDHAKAKLVNVDTIGKLTTSCAARIIYISTDAVFSESQVPHGINAIKKPLNYYGKTKLLAEEALLSQEGRGHCVVRTTPVGLNLIPNKMSFAEWIINSLRKRDKPLTLFTDAIITPISIWHLAGELSWVAENKTPEVLHICGAEPVSKYDFGMRLAEKLNLDTSLIKPISLKDVAFVAKRLFNQALDCRSFVEASRRTLPRTEETLTAIVQNLDSR